MSAYRDDLEAAQRRADELDAELARLRARNEQLDEQLAKDRELPAAVEGRSWIGRVMDALDAKPRSPAATAVSMIFAALFVVTKNTHPVLAVIGLIGLLFTPHMLASRGKEQQS